MLCLERNEFIVTVAVFLVHQPWASLVVAGIKRLEGRTWDPGHHEIAPLSYQ